MRQGKMNGYLHIILGMLAFIHAGCQTMQQRCPVIDDTYTPSQNKPKREYHKDAQLERYIAKINREGDRMPKSEYRDCMMKLVQRVFYLADRNDIKEYGCRYLPDWVHGNTFCILKGEDGVEYVYPAYLVEHTREIPPNHRINFTPVKYDPESEWLWMML